MAWPEATFCHALMAAQRRSAAFEQSMRELVGWASRVRAASATEAFYTNPHTTSKHAKQAWHRPALTHAGATFGRLQGQWCKQPRGD